MNQLIRHSIRFIFFVLLQSLVFNQLGIGFGINPMIYPLFIILLPLSTGIIPSLLLAFAMGLAIDGISNTYGLHTSSLLLVAYLRPIIYEIYSPREGYDPMKETNYFNMGPRWFFFAVGSLLLIHHLWFFALEIFKLNEFFYTMRKVILSAPVSLLFCILLQFVFIPKPKER